MVGWEEPMYHFHIADPIRFENKFRMTLDNMGWTGPRYDDYTSVAYWYQSEAGILPPAPPKADRTPKEFIRDQDMHRWRHEWRKNSGNGSKLWGNEVNEKPNT